MSPQHLAALLTLFHCVALPIGTMSVRCVGVWQLPLLTDSIMMAFGRALPGFGAATQQPTFILRLFLLLLAPLDDVNQMTLRPWTLCIASCSASLSAARAAKHFCVTDFLPVALLSPS